MKQRAASIGSLLFILSLVIAAQALTPAQKAILVSGITTFLPWGNSSNINVFSYLSVAQQAAVLGGTNTTDVTAPISAAINSCPSNGCQLYFPPGYYYTSTCNFTLANAVTILGGGSRALDGTGYVSVIACAAGSSSLFTVTAPYALFSQIALLDVAGSRTAGSAVLVNDSTNVNQKVDYTQFMADGFYDTIDIRVGNSWSMTSSVIQNSKHYGIRIQNTVNADAGDWFIGSGVNIYPANGAVAGVRYESSGGGKLGPGLKFTPNSGTFANCISVNFGSTTSTQMTIADVHCEGVSAAGFDITNTNWLGFDIHDNYVRTNSVTAAAININGLARGHIGPNILVGNGGAVAIATTNMSNVSIDIQKQAGFTNYLSQSGNSQVSNTMPVATLFQGQIYDTPGSASVALLPNQNAIFNAYFATSSNNLGYLLSGHTTFDGAWGRDSSLDQWCLGTTTNDSTLSQSSLCWQSTWARILKSNRVSKTTSYSIAADGLGSDAGIHFDNLGASGSITFSLPTAVVGLNYQFCVAAAQTLEVLAGTSTTINVGGSLTSSAGNITSAQVGACVTLEAYDTTHWIATALTGTGGSTGGGGWTIH